MDCKWKEEEDNMVPIIFLKLKIGLRRFRVIVSSFINSRLASEGWDRNNKNYMVDNLWKAADGAIVLMLKSPSIPGFDEV